MRLITAFSSIALVLSFLTPTASNAQTVKIGYIDSQAILQEAPGAREAQQEFERDMERYQQEVEQMGRELEQLITRYQQQQGALSNEAREAREEEIRQREQEYQRRVDQLETEAAQRRAELVEPILDRMSETIESIRSEGDYTVIFDVAARSIIAADPDLDLTNEVIRRLQEATPGDGRDR